MHRFVAVRCDRGGSNAESSIRPAAFTNYRAMLCRRNAACAGGVESRRTRGGVHVDSANYRSARGIPIVR